MSKNLDEISQEDIGENVIDYYMSPEAQKSHPVRDKINNLYETLRMKLSNVRDLFSYYTGRQYWIK